MQSFLSEDKDECRVSLVSQQAAKLKTELIGSCQRCDGRGRILTPYFSEQTLSLRTFPCKCYRRFIYLFDMMVSGVSYEMAREIIDIKWEDTEVVELDIFAGKEYPRGKTQLYADNLSPYMKNMEKVIDRGYSFLFIGVNNTGKTFASMKVLHHFLKYKHSGHFIKFRKLMKLINDSFQSDKKGRFSRDLLNEIANVDLLIIDEFGKETGKREHIAAEAEELLKDRDMARKPTIVITNNTYKELQELYTMNIVGAFIRNYRALLFNPKKNFRKLAREDWYK